MGIESWSTTPGSNTSAPPDGAPEGMAPSAVNDTMRQQMADHRGQWNDAQWFQYGDGDGTATITYVAANQFKVEGADVTAHYHVGRRVKVNGTTTGTVYGTITAVSFSTDTTVTVQLDSGSLSNEALTVWTSILRADQNAVPASSWSFRNLLINGDMRIAQRGTGTGSGGYGGPDRWDWDKAGDATVDREASSDAPASSGFSASIRFNPSSAESSIGATEFYRAQQHIEAQNLQHLMFGNALARPLALQFWIKATATGTYCVSLFQPDANRRFIREFSVDATDTWEFKTLTFPGDSAGTINNDNGSGLELRFCFGAGSNYQGAADTWAAGAEIGTANQVNAFNNASNDVRITGVQLEVGLSPTPFEHLPVAQQELLCFRYYQDFGSVDANDVITTGQSRGTTSVDTYLKYKTDMRAAPSISISGTFAIFEGATSQTTTTLSSAGAGISVAQLVFTGTGLTDGSAAMVKNSAGGSIELDAEL